MWLRTAPDLIRKQALSHQFLPFVWSGWPFFWRQPEVSCFAGIPLCLSPRALRCSCTRLPHSQLPSTYVFAHISCPCAVGGPGAWLRLWLGLGQGPGHGLELKAWQGPRLERVIGLGPELEQETRLHSSMDVARITVRAIAEAMAQLCACFTGHTQITSANCSKSTPCALPLSEL